MIRTLLLLPVLAATLIIAVPGRAAASPVPRQSSADFHVALDGAPGTHVLIHVCKTVRPDGSRILFPTEAECVLANDCTSDCVTPFPLNCPDASCFPARPRLLIDVQVPQGVVVSTLGSDMEGHRWVGCDEISRDSHRKDPESEAFRKRLYESPTLCLTRNSSRKSIADFTAADPFPIVTRRSTSPFAASQLTLTNPSTFSTESIAGGRFSITPLGMEAYDKAVMTCKRDGESRTFTASTPLSFTLPRSPNGAVRFKLWVGRLPSGTYFHCTARLTSKRGIAIPAPLKFDVKTKGTAPAASNGGSGSSEGSTSGVSGIGPIGL